MPRREAARLWFQRACSSATIVASRSSPPRLGTADVRACSVTDAGQIGFGEQRARRRDSPRVRSRSRVRAHCPAMDAPSAAPARRRVNPSSGRRSRSECRLRKNSASARDVVSAFAQRRDPDADHVDPVIEIVAETTGLDLTLEIAVGRRNQADIHVTRAGVADPPDLAALEEPQQPHLHATPASRRSRRGTATPPCASSRSPRLSATAPVNAPLRWPNSSLSSRASGMPPQLIGTKRCARRGPRVERAGDEFLSGPALAGDEHRAVGRCNAVPCWRDTCCISRLTATIRVLLSSRGRCS